MLYNYICYGKTSSNSSVTQEKVSWSLVTYAIAHTFIQPAGKLDA